MATMMNPEVKPLWLEALRSGEYAQGKGHLQTTDGRFCCLGVLCEVAVKQGVIPEPNRVDPGLVGYGEKEHTAVLPEEVAIWAGMLGNTVGHRATMERPALYALNDLGTPFTDIADIIEEEF